MTDLRRDVRCNLCGSEKYKAIFHSVLYRTGRFFISILNIQDKFAYLDTRDAMQVIAYKP